MIEIKNINKSFGTLHVLKDINLNIKDREIVTIFGPSGAGKTTLLQIIGTLSNADTGSLRYGGEEVTSMADKALSQFRNSHIGFVFQFHQLLPEFTAVENVILPALIGGMSRSEAVKKGEELLSNLGLTGRFSHRPAELSGGEKQRVAIARALINNPDVILADEPTGNLDSKSGVEVMKIIHQLHSEGRTIILITHDNLIAQEAERIIRIHDGKIVEDYYNKAK